MEILVTVYKCRHHESLVRTVKWGRGRVFVDLLGHRDNDPNMTYLMECTGLQVILLRGAEWAATREVMQEAPRDLPLEDTCTLRPGLKVPLHATNQVP